MKFEKPAQDVQVVGDFETTSYAVGDIAFVVDMFADKVYTYKERAIIRELSCNAHDSHVDAGNEGVLFDIHLPTHLEPWFSLRDYGLGLEDSEVRHTFAGIGVSTKRDSNKTIGCFGIGSLSPYSLCDSFTVKSWKDGKLRTYSCYRAEDRKPLIALLSEEDTTEPNGVEVSLNVEGRVGKFEEEAVNVFKWWDYTPNINSKQVIEKCEDWRNRYNFVGEDYAINAGWGDMVAIMGNIAYRIPDEIDTFQCDGYLRFELGEISFDTARENLSLDDKTRTAIKEKCDRIRGEIADEAIAKVEAEPCAFKRAILADTLRNGQLGRLIKGKNLAQFDLPETTTDIVYWTRHYRSTDKGTTKRLPIHHTEGHYEYYLHKDRMQTRIKHYLKEVSSAKTLIVLTDEQADECLIDRSILKDLDDLPTVPRNTYSSSGISSKVKTFVFDRTYKYYSDDDFYNEVELDDHGQEMVYVEISRWKPVDGHHLISDDNRQIKFTLEALEEHGIDVPPVLGLKTAFTKTKKFADGNFITLDEYVKREYAKIEPKTFYKFKEEDARRMRELANFAESNELSEFIELADSNKNDKIAKVCESLDLPTGEMEEDDFLQEWMDAFFSKYELLTVLDSWDIRSNKEKVARYIGATTK